MGCGGIEFVDGPFFDGLVMGFGGLAVGAEGGEIDFEAEDLGDGVELLLAAGCGGCIVGHEVGDESKDGVGNRFGAGEPVVDRLEGFPELIREPLAIAIVSL